MNLLHCPAPFPALSPVQALDAYGLVSVPGWLVLPSTLTVIGPWNYLVVGGGSGGKSQSSLIAANCRRMARRSPKCIA